MEKNSNKKYLILFLLITIAAIVVVYIISSNRIKEYKIYSEDIADYLADNEKLPEFVKGEDGADGIDGIDGEQGIQGAQGQVGVVGTDGVDGTDGSDGSTGIQGIQGIQGVQGLTGADGADGSTGTVTIDTNSDITGILKGTGTKVAAAVADVDYLTPGTVASTYLRLDGTNGPVTGDLLIKPSTNSIAAFTVQDKDGNVVFSVDTVNKRLGIGTDTPSSAFDLLGSARFGDGATDYSEFEADGTLKMNGAATVWDDLRVQILTRTSARVSPDFTSGFGGNTEIYSYQFDPDTDNNVYFEAQMPHGWAGTKIYPHVHWSPTTTGTGAVKWEIECSWVNYQGTFGTSFTYDLTGTISEAGQWKHMIANNEAGLTPTASQNAISTMLICRLYRDGSDVADTYTGEASLVSFDIHYEIDTIGSRGIFTK